MLLVKKSKNLWHNQASLIQHSVLRELWDRSAYVFRLPRASEGSISCWTYFL